MTLIPRLLIGSFVAIGALLALAGIRGISLLELRPDRIARRRDVDDRKIVEALAVWTEQLRDTIAGASGIEQAITDFDCHPLPHVSRRVNQRSKPMVIMA